MKILVLYDSVYGNTKEIARAIAGAFGKSDTVKLVQADEVKLSDLNSLDLFIAGSPTNGGRATPVLQTFLDSIPSNALKGVKVASFDTRFEAKNVNFLLKTLLKTFDYAAPKIATILTSNGGQLAVPPEGFFVTGKEGPLKQSELARAARWTAALCKLKK